MKRYSILRAYEALLLLTFFLFTIPSAADDTGSTLETEHISLLSDVSEAEEDSLVSEHLFESTLYKTSGGLFGFSTDSFFTPYKPVLTVDPGNNKCFLLAGLQDTTGLPCSGEDSTIPFSAGWYDNTGTHTWFFRGCFFKKTSTENETVDETSVPDAAYHTSTVTTSAGENNTYTWADTVNDTTYSETEASFLHFGFSGGWTDRSFSIGVSGEYEQTNGDIDSPSDLTESNYDTWTEIWNNLADDDEVPKLELHYIEHRKVRSADKTSVFNIFIPVSYKNHSLEVSVSSKWKDMSSSDELSFYPATDDTSYTFQSSSSSVTDTVKAFSAGGRYIYTLSAGDFVFNIGAYGFAAFVPGEDEVSSSVTQSWARIINETDASFRTETDETVNHSELFSWGGGSSFRVSLPVQLSKCTLAAALDVSTGMKNLSDTVDRPCGFSWVEYTDGNGDSDFNDASDQIESRTKTVSISENAEKCEFDTTVLLPVALLIPVNSVTGLNCLSGIHVDFTGAFNPSVTASYIINKSGRADVITTRSVTGGSGTEASKTQSSQSISIGSDNSDFSVSMTVPWAFGFVLHFRGNVTMTAAFNGCNISIPDEFIIQTVIPLL
jgi:hypothetical protein